MTTSAAPAPSLRLRLAGEIRAHMARRGVYQQDLAEAIGKTQTWLSRRLVGDVPFTVEDLSSICALLDISMIQLLEGLEPEPTSAALDRRHLRFRYPGCITEVAPEQHEHCALVMAA